MKKIGIITFHKSYNCGSMLESYAIYRTILKLGYKTEIVDFQNDSQKELYAVFNKNNSIKNILKNLVIFPHRKRICYNNQKYEDFCNKNFNLSKKIYKTNQEIEDIYDAVIAGSDQIWNISIEDYDDAYFLNWVKKAKRIAYAPSFGAKRIEKNTKNPEKFKKYLLEFDALSIREDNGKAWIKELTGIDVPVLPDPTLLLDKSEYDKLIPKDIKPTGKKYIFFYCPSFNPEICEYVSQISEKYNLEVIAWSAKSYYTKRVARFGFKLPEYENPEMYLYLIKNAELVITTSFHGTIFSTIYRKNFITVKNGGMYGDDDRVKTLLRSLDMMDRLIPFKFNREFNYLEDVDYKKYDEKIAVLRHRAIKYLKESLK